MAFLIPISSAVEPKRLRPGLGDSEPLEDFPVGDEPFSKFFRSPPESSCKKQKKNTRILDCDREFKYIFLQTEYICHDVLKNEKECNNNCDYLNVF